MSLKPRQTASYNRVPTAFRDFKAVEWKVGNAVLDTSKLTKGQVIKPFTAIFLNESTGLFELVASDTPATMKSALITGSEEVVIEDTTTNEMVSAIRKASLIEERCTGVTANFKTATQGRLTFDV
ncbi:hypothetical protein GTN30_06440 [Macrococcoides canis]|uniref:Uncharacterized protein n=1 Tax=Macrococcoides canis TaxID=1855823 RepID=A0AAE6X0Q1_9STAP|nr:hypothetical protein [Macrococcus canis]QIH78306.1 hypothetical protein GTN30_06440 [Macrococcus canis]